VPAELIGRRILVTGGGSGIGRAVALGAAQAGAEVIVSGRRGDQLDETCRLGAEAPGSLSAHPVDVTDPQSVAGLLAAVDACWPAVDGLVNCAGVTLIGYAEELSDADLVRVLDINLVGSFRMAREVGRRMIAAGAGSIVNVGSLTSLGGFPGRAAYAISKHGVVGLTKALAAEWGSRGVRVNALIPGFVRTPMTDAAVQRGLLQLSAIEARTPVGRRAGPEEMVGPVLFLLSDAASFVTGDCLVADGGWTSYVGPVNPYGLAPVD
jgi:3-oxoacyl-[acyl-carrier protein] reductase